MEPRIATLLGDSSLDRSTLDPILLLPPPSVAPRRPHPVEPTPDDARTSAHPRRSEFIGNDHYGPSRAQAPTSSSRQKSGVPIAEVLNDETPNAGGAQLQTLPTPSASSTTPFSGRLSDILLDPTQQYPSKRRKIDGQTTPPGLNGNENSKLKLPKLPQLPKKTAKRPRIPPLLQGLHQPPPLPPEGRLFPPITGESGGFGRDIGDRVSLRSPPGLDRAKDRDILGDGNAEAASTATRAEQEKAKGNGKEQEQATAHPMPVQVNNKENQIQSRGEKRTEGNSSKIKEARKRKKWSDQETKDLLIGVSKFGIGNWKKILNCADFNFNQRTAVDLKDRFRTCCPGEGLKVRKAKRKHEGPESESQASALAALDTVEQLTGLPLETGMFDTANQQRASRYPRVTHRKGPAELAEMGIQGPFVKSNRRERREFTKEDDENLLKGYEKYGAVWHLMRNDGELGFTTRHPTDLRDRFRIRYPEKYAKAGYKLKPKDEQMLREKEKENADSQVTESQGSTITATTSDRAHSQNENEHGRNKETNSSLDTAVATASTSAPSNANLRTHALLQPLLNSFPTSFDEFGDLVSEDGDSTQSPITLNRNIFHWADANPAQSTSTPVSINVPAVSSLMNDLPTNSWTGTDGIHIDPLATLKLPMTSLPGSSLSAMSYPSGANPLTLTLAVNPTSISGNNASTISHGNINTSTAAATTTSSSKQSVNHLLRTPNLPTIVFPRVPVASARSAVHNLPPPADLLSGLELDARADTQTTGFVLDDSMGFALPVGTQGYQSAATLAPLTGNGMGKSLLGLERGFLDESNDRRNFY